MKTQIIWCASCKRMHAFKYDFENFIIKDGRVVIRMVSVECKKAVYLVLAQRHFARIKKEAENDGID